MNRDQTGGWQHLRTELQHWDRATVDDLETFDAVYDYTRGRVSVRHPPRHPHAEGQPVQRVLRRL